jgi:hypothetical protein
MEETLSTSQWPFLTPVEIIKQRLSEDCNEPESLKSFADPFLKENGGRSERIIWVREDSNVFVGLGKVKGFSQVYQQSCFQFIIDVERFA